jgi:hypothetical protein
VQMMVVKFTRTTCTHNRRKMQPTTCSLVFTACSSFYREHRFWPLPIDLRVTFCNFSLTIHTSVHSKHDKLSTRLQLTFTTQISTNFINQTLYTNAQLLLLREWWQPLNRGPV